MFFFFLSLFLFCSPVPECEGRKGSLGGDDDDKGYGTMKEGRACPGRGEGEVDEGSD